MYPAVCADMFKNARTAIFPLPSIKTGKWSAITAGTNMGYTVSGMRLKVYFRIPCRYTADRGSEKMYPQARVLRMDMDTGRQGKYEKILAAFSAQEADISRNAK